MNATEKMDLLVDLFEEDGEITTETELSTLANWDSMTKLSLIVLFDDEFGKKLKGSDIAEFKTVGDIINFMD